MANTKSAKKAAKQNEKARVRNLARRTAIKSSIKKALVALEQGDSATSEALLRTVASQLGRAKGKGVVHRKTAARKLSRLAKRVDSAKAATK